MRRQLGFLCLLLAAGNAHGVCHKPSPKLCSVLFGEEVAVHARVEFLRNLVEPDDPEGVSGWLYHLQVLRVYRGKTGDFFDVISENTTSRVVLEEGKDYLVFASLNPNGIYETGNSCDDFSGSLFSPAIEKQIESLLEKKKSSVEGEVVDREWRPMAGVPIKIIGAKTEYNVKTRSNGSFIALAPPGRYRVMPPAGFRESAYSFHDLEKRDIAVNPGECAQIQFQEWK